MRPRLSMRMSGACRFTWRAALAEQWMRPATELLSMRLAVFTVSPNRQYRGFLSPTTCATHGPEWNPTRICTVPIDASSSSIWVSLAAATAATAKRAMRAAWSSGCSLTRLVTAMYASPIVSTLNTSYSTERRSKHVYSRCSMLDTLDGCTVEDMVVNPTMSEKKMVTTSRSSGSGCWPRTRASATCLGNTSKSTALALSAASFCCLIRCSAVDVMLVRSRREMVASSSSKDGRASALRLQHCSIMPATVAVQLAGIPGVFEGTRLSSRISAITVS
mmetsp:Transcript_28167/g.56850  ORF Transcript_28167/g.56850 Transcript_28167/m.56850 type:complete len:276 (+) Transcript_28167:205-1032(+)